MGGGGGGENQVINEWDPKSAGNDQKSGDVGERKEFD